ncbi:MAG: methyl transferase [Parcubacteria group bacterium Gr01-1014_46]|nr:MAG: methyl transferase [Parcubacteria group bacterium Gr01-1014_46]
MNIMPETNKPFNLEEEATKYFTKHYPEASDEEIAKQVLDWKNKISVGSKIVDFFKERIGNVSGKKILDVGFGSGGIVISFGLAGGVVSGVDVDLELKEIAKENLRANNVSADLQIYNGIDLPYPDNYFDYIVCSSVLEHVSFPNELLADSFRVLKVGGRMFLTLPNRYYPKETHTLAYFVSYMPRRMANLYLKLLKRSPLEQDNLHFYSYFAVLRMLRKTSYKFELLYSNLSKTTGIKKFLTLVLKKLNIHYTIFLKQLMFIIEKK